MSTMEDVHVYMELTGQLKFFLNRLSCGHLRIGQAFFNSLEEDDQELLRGTSNDTFYKDDWESVCAALDVILSV